MNAVMSEEKSSFPIPLISIGIEDCRKVTSDSSLLNACKKVLCKPDKAVFVHQSEIATTRVLPALSQSRTSLECRLPDLSTLN